MTITAINRIARNLTRLHAYPLRDCTSRLYGRAYMDL